MEDGERTNFACREYRDDAPLDHTSSMHGPYSFTSFERFREMGDTTADVADG